MSKVIDWVRLFLNTEIGKILVVSLILIGMIIGLTSLLNDTVKKQKEELRATHTPTKYEYKVISVTRINSFWQGNYYEVIYLGDDNILSSKQFKENEKLRVILSNESKLVIENPELNGYPLKNTLYWGDLQ